MGRGKVGDWPTRQAKSPGEDQSDCVVVLRLLFVDNRTIVHMNFLV